MGHMHKGVALAAVLFVFLPAANPARFTASTNAPVDLELVLAVDVSGSVDDREFGLQMDGIAAAFRTPEVQKAIRSGPLGRIAVSLVLWSDPRHSMATTPWRIISGPAEAEAFAQLVQDHPRSIPAGSTGIGQALWFCMRHIQGNGMSGALKVIDLSGDGKETAPRDFFVRLWQGRAAAHGAGITVNGLAILAEEPELDRYYRAELITGPDAFAIAAASYEDFAEAMYRKLLREIEYRPAVSRRGLVPKSGGAAHRLSHSAVF